MAEALPPTKAPKCATCKGTGRVLLQGGTYVNCLPCSIPLYGGLPLYDTTTEDAPGAVDAGPGDASEESNK